MDLFEDKQSALHQELDEQEALNDKMKEYVDDKFGGEAAEAYAPETGPIILPDSWNEEDPDEDVADMKIREKIELYRDQLSNTEADMPLPIDKMKALVEELAEVVGDKKERLGFKTEEEIAEEEFAAGEFDGDEDEPDEDDAR